MQKTGLHNMRNVSKKLLRFLRNQGKSTKKRELSAGHSTRLRTLHAQQARSAVSYCFPDKPQCNSGNLVFVCPWKRLQVLTQSYRDGTKELKSSRKTTDLIFYIQPLGVNAPSPTYGKVTQSWSSPISYQLFSSKIAGELAWTVKTETYHLNILTCNL